MSRSQSRATIIVARLVWYCSKENNNYCFEPLIFLSSLYIILIGSSDEAASLGFFLVYFRSDHGDISDNNIDPPGLSGTGGAKQGHSLGQRARWAGAPARAQPVRPNAPELYTRMVSGRGSSGTARRA